MKVVLTETLHARPASLLVRLAARLTAEVELHSRTGKADARRILEVLALAAAKGDEIVIEARGEDAEGAVRAIAELVEQGFSRDLVPETGSVEVEGIAIGYAVLAMAEEESPSVSRGVEEERARARSAVARVEEELTDLVEALPESEAALFEPERAIVRDAAASIEASIEAGRSAEDAVLAVLGGAAVTDLIADARTRLLDVLAGRDGLALDRMRNAREGHLVLVTDALTPSLVASVPKRVHGIVAAEQVRGRAGAHTSHAVILARGRGLPLALVPAHVVLAIVEGDEMVVDTTGHPARVWVTPSEEVVAAARTRLETRTRQREHEEEGAALASDLGVELWVNVGTLHDQVPATAQGVGLLRTELLFAARSRAPSEEEQVASLIAVGRAARGKVVTARLFDAGGDKPLPWLSSGSDERGLALLFANPAVLATQLRAMARAAESSPIRVLLPMCRSAADVQAIRRSIPGLAVGAMIETPAAAREAESIALAADFVCIGTNDLAALVLGTGRAEVTRALDGRVLAVVREVVRAAHTQGRSVSVCGEIAADPRGSRVLVGLGVDALSVAPTRFAEVARALSRSTLEECRAAALAAASEVVP